MQASCNMNTVTDSRLKTDFDILIVGGGMVGSTLALALRDGPFSVAMIEAYPSEEGRSPSFDDRSSALSLGSQRILDALGFWSDVSAGAEPIHSIHVSDRGFWGTTRMTAAELRVDALGYVIENRAFGRVLNQRLAASESVQVFCPAVLSGIGFEKGCAHVTMVYAGQLCDVTARLVVAADGAHSMVRRFLDVQAITESYRQTAVIANVIVQQGVRYMAFERFTAGGPIAFLPMREHQGQSRYAVVWTVAADDAANVLALSDEAFLSELQARFGYRLGRLLQVGQRVGYPLVLSNSAQGFAERTLFVGNAMQALHPVAGQGFNLGLRDILDLRTLLLSMGAAVDIGSDYFLQRYTQLRSADRDSTVRRTDRLVKLFSNTCAPLGVLRGMGLTLVDNVPLLRQQIARTSMGLRL